MGLIRDVFDYYFRPCTPMSAYRVMDYMDKNEKKLLKELKK